MRKFVSLTVIYRLGAVLAVGCLASCSMWEGKKARETGRTVDQYTSDKRVTERVQEALKSTPVYKFPDVHVDTSSAPFSLAASFIPRSKSDKPNKSPATSPALTGSLITWHSSPNRRLRPDAPRDIR